MMKYKSFFILFLMGSLAYSQARIEREHRIRKSQFPTLETDFLSKWPEIKKISYYIEMDSMETTYILKFKKDRLFYHIDYDDAGRLKASGFRVQEVDIPEETYTMITTYLHNAFDWYKIKRIRQEYPVGDLIQDNPLKNTFQNLMRPDNIYKLLVRAKKAGKKEDLELWFDAEGTYLSQRIALPTNFDRVLY